MRRASRKSGSLSVSASEYSFLSIRTGTRDSKRFRWFFRVSTLRPTAPAADPPGPRPRRWSRARIRRIARRWRESRRTSRSRPLSARRTPQRTRRSVGPAPSRDRTRRRARRSPRRPRRRDPAPRRAAHAAGGGHAGTRGRGGGRAARCASCAIRWRRSLKRSSRWPSKCVASTLAAEAVGAAAASAGGRRGARKAPDGSDRCGAARGGEKL